MRVHILVTCLHRPSFISALLVVKSIRIGFPTTELVFHGNNLDHEKERAVREAARIVGASFTLIPETSEGPWIEYLLEHEREPFWICHTDLKFYSKVEDWSHSGRTLFAGKLEGATREHPYLRVESAERLHPSLMWFNPNPLRAAMRGWGGTSILLRHVETSLIRPHLIPRAELPPYLYDTCAGLWHALGEKHGAIWGEEMTAAYRHLGQGSYRHLLPNAEKLAAEHEAAWNYLP